MTRQPSPAPDDAAALAAALTKEVTRALNLLRIEGNQPNEAYGRYIADYLTGGAIDPNLWVYLPLPVHPPAPPRSYWMEFLAWEEEAARQGSGMTAEQKQGAALYRSWLVNSAPDDARPEAAPPAPLPLDVERLREAAEQAVHLVGNYLWNEDGESEDWLITAHDGLRRALACGRQQPGNLSEPAAAAENAEGCTDCGQPWWAHPEYASLATPEPTDPRCPVCHHTGAEHGTLASPGCATCGCEALWATPEPTEDGG